MKLATKSLLFYSFFAKIPALFAGDKILFGKTVEDKNEYPYFVSAGGCGGALIAPDVVLTAAHCAPAFSGHIYIGGLLNKNLYTVSGNTYTLKKRRDGERRTCIEWIIDPEYIDNKVLVHDYALCKLNKPVTSIQPIKLHDGSDALSNGQELLVMGHGKTESDSGSTQLLDTTVEYVDTYDRSEDSQMYADTFDEEGQIIGGICNGDSGGPLVWRKDGIDTVVGVVSFTQGEEKCLSSFPDGYARVSYRYDWIVETMWTFSDFPKAFPMDGPPGYCQDDPDWTFREESEQSCQWFQEDKQHTWRNPVKFCGKTANGTGPSNTDKRKVWAYCKRTCYELGNTNGCKSIFWY